MPALSIALDDYWTEARRTRIDWNEPHVGGCGLSLDVIQHLFDFRDGTWFASTTLALTSTKRRKRAWPMGSFAFFGARSQSSFSRTLMVGVFACRTRGREARVGSTGS